MSEFPSCRKTCLLVLLFLLFCRRRHRHASFPNYIAARTIWHNGQFGMEDVPPTALMPTRMLIVTSLEGYCRLPGTKPMYSYVDHNPQPTPNVRQCIVTYMADSGRHGAPLPMRCRQQLPRMLADCCMWRRWEWSTTAAVGRQRPPWGHFQIRFPLLNLS
jgi:hypothetical protein